MIARWGFALAAVVLLAAIAAPILAPYHPNQQLDAAAGRHLAPGAEVVVVRLRDGRTLFANRVDRSGDELVLERLGRSERLAAADVSNLEGGSVSEHQRFLLGSDRFGRDLLSRIVYGARVTLAVALPALALALTLGIAVGALAALGGRIVDSILMRAVDALLAFPALPLALALAALLRSTEVTLVLVLAAISWMSLARLVRAEILGLKEREFVAAARATGQRPVAVFFRHLLPNAWAPILADSALRVGDLILVEASLSFLGLGIQPPTPSWGSMIAEGRDVLHSAWWVAAFPGLAIALAVIACNLIADGLRDRMDPKRALL
jgi:peptide/nickel transport system permease protein